MKKVIMLVMLVMFVLTSCTKEKTVQIVNNSSPKDVSDELLVMLGTGLNDVKIIAYVDGEISSVIRVGDVPKGGKSEKIKLNKRVEKVAVMASYAKKEFKEIVKSVGVNPEFRIAGYTYIDNGNNIIVYDDNTCVKEIN